jgi:hypothetical protein
MDPAPGRRSYTAEVERRAAERARLRAERDKLRATDPEGLAGRTCVPPDSPGHPRKDHTVLQCLHVVLKEEWQHHRYAVRDLGVLEQRPS